MDLILQNPAGLWMLLGIPVVLAIHLLQNKPRHAWSSTLFLLEHLPEESRHGAALQRIRNSAALWLQLVAVLVATILLAQPLRLRADSAQAVAFVLDASCSMQAFRWQAVRQIDESSARLSRATRQTVWQIVPSDPRQPAIYSGGNRSAMLSALSAWRPASGEHDIRPALLRARDLVGPDGTVVFVTDHKPEELPPRTWLLAVGTPIDHAGFGSLHALMDEGGALLWRAMLVSHAATPLHRTLTSEQDGHPVEQREIRLAPGEVRLVEGRAPPGAGRVVLRLEADAFALDDSLYVVAPAERPVPYALELPEGAAGDQAVRMMAAFSAARESGADETPSLVWREAGQTEDAPARAEIILDAPGGEEASWLSGPVLPEEHPLTRDLAWQPLLCRVAAGFALQSDDVVLLWMENEPLVVLRETPGSLRLFLRFDWASSNAGRVPAMVLLLHRFVEKVRRGQPGHDVLNVELGQPIELVADPDGPPLETFRDGGDVPVTKQPPNITPHAPSEPGFFTIRQGERTLFRGAANFSDTREADFKNAGSHDDLPELGRAHVIALRHPALPNGMLLALLAVLVLASWLAQMPGRRT